MTRRTSNRSDGRLVLVNNSRETFTPTVSGAIGTCLWEIASASRGTDVSPLIVTNSSHAEPFAWDETVFVQPAPAHNGVLARIDRVHRRLTGWARPDQRVYAHRTLRILRQIGPSAIILSNDPELAVFMRRRLPDTRVVHWFHNLEIAADRWRRTYTADPAIRSVAVSAYLARAVEQVYRMTPFAVDVALNGVNSKSISPGEVEHGVLTIGFVGRIAVEKAPDTLLLACIRLADRGLQFRLQLVGDTNFGFGKRGSFGDRVNGLIDDLRIRGIDVRQLGHLGRDGVTRALRDSDIHVVPSRWDEPCGLTVLEGLASGQAVVASATGGTPELLAGAGILFPRDDVDELAAALETILQDDKKRLALRRLARGRAEQLTWSATWSVLARAASNSS